MASYKLKNRAQHKSNFHRMVFLVLFQICFGAIKGQNCEPGRYWNGSNCVLCPEGYYCAGGSTFPVLCPAGKYCPAGSSNAILCPANTYNPNNGSTSSSACLPCTSGTTSQPGAASCYTACPAGQYWTGSTCLTCPPGKYCPEGTTSPINCPAGSYCPLGSASPTLCPDNTYNNLVGASSSGQCLSCPPGTSSPPGSTSCSSSCAAGEYWNGTNCILCEPGRYCPYGSNTSLLCPPGYFCPEGTTVPIACPENTYNAIAGAASAGNCIICANGTSSGPASIGCYVINDGFCDNGLGENCQNSPTDCACQSSMDCIEGECVYTIEGNVGVNNQNPATSLDVKGGLAHRGLNIETSIGPDSVLIPENLSYATVTGYTFGEKVVKMPVSNVNGQRLIIKNAMQARIAIPLLYGNVYVDPGQHAEFINSGTGWNLLSMAFGSGDFWKVNGNSNTDSGYDGLGTNDSTDLNIKTYGINRMIVHANGSVDFTNDILTNGIGGEYGEVLTSNGNGTMRWSAPDQPGSIINVRPGFANIDSLVGSGYKVVGESSNPVNITTDIVGGSLVDAPTSFGRGAHLFYHSASQKIYAVKSNSITSFSLDMSNYGTKQTYSVPVFNLNNTKPIFTGSKILIFPHFIFDCTTNTTTSIASIPCSGFVLSDAQAWTGSELVIYGPEGGLEYNPTTSAYECFEHPMGNIYRAQSSAIYTGDRVIFYGGYIAVGVDTFVDNNGLIYFPSTNTYGEITPGPIVRNHIALWTGTEMMVYGGKTTLGAWHDTYQFYNPITNAWNAGYTPVTAPYCDRSRSVPIVSGSKVFTSNYVDVNDLIWKSFNKHYFNYTTKTKTTFTLNIEQVNPLALNNAVMVDDQIHYFPELFNVPTDPISHFVFNVGDLKNAPGYLTNLLTTQSYKIADGTNYALAFGELGLALVFNKAKMSWFRTSTVNQPNERQGHVCIHLGGDKFLIWGGANGSTHYNDGKIYNALTDTWTSAPTSGLAARKEAGAARLGNFVLIYGGTSGSSNLNDGRVYNISANIWLAVASAGSAPGGNLEDKIFATGSTYYVFANNLYQYTITPNAWTNTNIEGPFYPGDADGVHVMGGIQNNYFQHKISETNVTFPDLANVGFLYTKPLALGSNRFLFLGDTYSRLYHPVTETYQKAEITTGFSVSNQVNKITISPNFHALPGAMVLDSYFGQNTDGLPMFLDNNVVGGPVTEVNNIKTVMLQKN